MKIMIVDDDAGARRLLQMHLDEFGTHTTAANGQEAVEAFKQAMDADEPFDLILMDYLMPTMDGVKTLEAIRRIEREHQITRAERVKVIMVTMVDKESEIQKAFYTGCDAYVIRPERKERLLDEIRNVGLLS